MKIVLVILSVGATVFTHAELLDPTRPPNFATSSAVQAKAVSMPRLRSILAGGERRLALINNIYIAEGERRAGIEVVRIGVDDVVVRHSGEEKTLTLNTKRVVKEFK